MNSHAMSKPFTPVLRRFLKRWSRRLLLILVMLASLSAAAAVLPSPDLTAISAAGTLAGVRRPRVSDCSIPGTPGQLISIRTCMANQKTLRLEYADDFRFFSHQ